MSRGVNMQKFLLAESGRCYDISKVICWRILPNRDLKTNNETYWILGEFPWGTFAPEENHEIWFQSFTTFEIAAEKLTGLIEECTGAIYTIAPEVKE